MRDADGQPMAGATVGIARPYRGVSYRPYNKYAGEADGSDYAVLSDAQGAFTVRFLPKGTLDVWATIRSTSKGTTTACDGKPAHRREDSPAAASWQARPPMHPASR